MKINNEELNQLVDGLDVLLSKIRETSQLNLPAKVSYFINKNYITMKNAVKPYLQTKDMLIKKYGELNEETKKIEIDTSNVDITTKFFEELKPLLIMDINVDIQKIKFDELGLGTIPQWFWDYAMFMIED